VLGKSWRGGPCIYWTSSPCRRSTDSATTAVSSARQHLECPETSQRCSKNVSFYTDLGEASADLSGSTADPSGRIDARMKRSVTLAGRALLESGGIARLGPSGR
jgi:hypothetical protein